MIGRRGFLGILVGAVAAPMIVRPGLIMPVKALKIEPIGVQEYLRRLMEHAADQLALEVEDQMLHGQSWVRATPDGFIKRIPPEEWPTKVFA